MESKANELLYIRHTDQYPADPVSAITSLISISQLWKLNLRRSVTCPRLESSRPGTKAGSGWLQSLLCCLHSTATLNTAGSQRQPHCPVYLWVPTSSQKLDRSWWKMYYSGLWWKCFENQWLSSQHFYFCEEVVAFFLTDTDSYKISGQNKCLAKMHHFNFLSKTSKNFPFSIWLMVFVILEYSLLSVVDLFDSWKFPGRLSPIPVL